MYTCGQFDISLIHCIPGFDIWRDSQQTLHGKIVHILAIMLAANELTGIGLHSYINVVVEAAVEIED